MKKRSRQQGLTLLEVLFVLILMGLIIVSLTLYFKQDKEAAFVQQAANQIMTIKSAMDDYTNSVSDVYSDYHEFAGSGKININTLISLGSLTNLYKTSPWGTPVSISPGAYSQGSCLPGPAYKIATNTKSLASCKRLEDVLKQAGIDQPNEVGCSKSADIDIFICINIQP